MFRGPAVSLLLLVCVGGCPSVTTEKNAKLSRTHYLLGSDYVKKKMPDAAKRELFKAIELDSENKEANQLLGVIYFLEGLQKMNLLERKQCLKGRAASEQRREANKEFRRCEQYFRRSLELEEQKEKKIDSDDLNYLANVALHFKRYDEAISLAKKSLDNILYASRHLALGTLGWAYYHKGNKVAAAKELRQSVFHEPKFCVGRYRLARVYYENKKFDDAIEHLKKVTEDEKCPIQDAHHLLGLAYMKKRDMELARNEFNTCVKLNPKSCLSEECRRLAN